MSGEYSGSYGEEVCCNLIQTGFFEAAKDNNVKATFVGHDHRNDYNGTLDGVELVYGRKTGHNGYNPINQRGGRVIVLEEKLEKNGVISLNYHHYVINEDGTTDFQSERKRRITDVQHYCVPANDYPPSLEKIFGNPSENKIFMKTRTSSAGSLVLNLYLLFCVFVYLFF